MEEPVGVSVLLGAILRGSAAGFAFVQASSFALEPWLSEEPTLLPIAVQAASRAGSTGVGVVTACLVCTSMLISLGSGFLLAAMVMKLLKHIGSDIPWLTAMATSVSLILGAATTGVLWGLLPLGVYIIVQLILVVAVFFYSNINQLTQALSIIFVTLYVSVYYGRMGVLLGLFLTGVTISFLCALRKALTERIAPRPKCVTECKLLERVFFYSVVVGMLGFGVGLGAGELENNSEAEMVIMIESVLWVAFLSAGILGAGLGTVAMVDVGTEMAGNIAIGTSVLSAIALRVIWNNVPSLGARASTGGILGITVVAAVSLSAASVAAKEVYNSRFTFLTTISSVAVGVIAASKVSSSSLMGTSELTTAIFVSMGSYVLGAPKSPFNTRMQLRRGLLTGPELVKEIGMETITAAAAPIGAGALGVAVLGTAALGKLGTVGVLLALALALGSTLSGMLGRTLPAPAERVNTQ
ncbi:uncharacterized protein LOC110153919 [Boleophthalmus pectinirostris]|uniref:uncharacterized protein LOC110153919 n=1 Tax=Boleophthalmus pectinirostris TaxID=150288 RepID=UPI000A1C3C3D|nr:uncharacterized protein LOC110153919 [Boleophthalmus pectinirostris]